MAIPALAIAFGTANAVACGGFFCQSAPVDQAGERIVFTANSDGTITSLIEIQYTGTAADFSWILPIPEAIGVDGLAVPDEGAAVFEELHRLTDVQIIPPPSPPCAELRRLNAAVADEPASEEGGVEVFASGEVGPFGFDVIGAEDPAALTTWLRDNNYRVDPSMEPLIDVYVEEEFAFVAMRLLDGETSESITPIELTYAGTEPMIPLRLTAVAAQDDMPIFTWVFGDNQAVPTNYAHMDIETAEITFSSFGQDNYRRLVADRADANDGRAFITEFAGAADALPFEHPYLEARLDRYVTRLFTVISPEEMTADPSFAFDDRSDVSNVRDASKLRGLYDCERERGFPFDAIDPFDGGNQVTAAPKEGRLTSTAGDDDDSEVVIEVGGDDVATEEIVEDGVDGSGDAEVTAADDGAETDRPSPSGLWLVGALVALGVIIGTIVVTRSSREEPDD